jgi:DNA repair protein RecN (Recombination protein N)
LAVAVTGCRRGESNKAQPAAASANANPQTLIFDEIDAGVGGAVAVSVAQLMRELGRNRQVLAVTHLAQVAAHADAHFVVSKGPDTGKENGRAAKATTTHSDVRLLEDGQDRLAELARMIGGSPIGVAIAHAKDMLERATADSSQSAPSVKLPTKISAKTSSKPVGKTRKAA